MMDNLKAAEILSEIGGMVAHEAGPDPDGAFLYAEAEDGVVRPMLSKDLGSVVQDLDVSSALAMRILDLWNAADNDKRWAALFLTVQGDQFDARFQHAEEWGEEDAFERRARVLSAKYGDKEIRYLPFEDVNRLTS